MKKLTCLIVLLSIIACGKSNIESELTAVTVEVTAVLTPTKQAQAFQPTETSLPTLTSTPTSIPSATENPTTTLQPTSTPQPTTPTSAQTPNVLPDIWTAIGTPMPVVQAAISPENIGEIREIGRWGRGHVIDALYSPDGKKLAVATPIGVYFYDVDTFDLLDVIQVDRELTAIAISSDWNTLALGYAFPGGIELREVKSGLLLDTWETDHEVNYLVFTPDSEFLITRVYRDNISSRRVSDGVEVSSISGGQFDLTVDGKTAVSYSQDSIQLWQLENGIFEEIPTSIQVDAEIASLQFSPDGKYLAIGQYWALHVWVFQLSDQTLLHTFNATPPEFASQASKIVTSKPALRSGPGPYVIYDLAFDSSAKELAVTTGFDELVLWDIETGKLKWRIQEAGKDGIVFTPISDRLCTWEHTLIQWRRTDGVRLHTLNQHIGGVWDIIFMPDGITIAIASNDGSIYIRRIKEGALYKQLRTGNGGVISLDVTSDGQTLIAGLTKSTVQFWDLTLDRVTTQSLEGWEVSDVSISADTRFAISSIADGGMQLWQMRNYELLEWGFGYGGVAYHPIEFSPTESIFAALIDENAVGIWPQSDVHSTPRRLSGPEPFWAKSFVYSDDGMLLASGSVDGQIWLWRVADGELLQQFERGQPEMGVIETVTFSPDQKLLATIFRGEIFLWNVVDGSLLLTISSQHGWPKDVAFSNDGNYLAIAALDGTVRLWGIP